MWVSNKVWQSTILRDIYKSPLSVRWVSGEIRKGLAASRWPVVEGFYSNRQDIEAMSADRLWQQRICWNSQGETICVWTPQGGDRGKRQMLKKCKRKKESTGTWKHCLFVLWVCLFVCYFCSWMNRRQQQGWWQICGNGHLVEAIDEKLKRRESEKKCVLSLCRISLTGYSGWVSTFSKIIGQPVFILLFHVEEKIRKIKMKEGTKEKAEKTEWKKKTKNTQGD